jgi:NitT/TauT family transport system permease protein
MTRPSSRPGRWAREYALPAGAIAGLVGLWQVACDVARIPVWLLPAPAAIVRDTWTWADRIPGHLWVTFTEVMGGFAVAVLVGVPLAIAIVYSPIVRRIVYPILLVFQSVPKVALAPLFLIWVGYGLQSNVLVAAIVAFFPMVVNTATGLDSVEPELLQLTRSLRAGALKVFWKVRLPWALPHIFSGMKVAMTLSVIGAVVGEFVGSDKGLGYLILTASSNMNTAIVFGVMVVLSALGIAVFWAVCLAEILICPWYLPPDGEGR